MPAQAEKSVALEKVTLQLKWFHQFQFAGYYAAKEQGYYAAEGLDVEIRERSPNKDVIQQVSSGEIDFAISDSGVLSYYAKGEPIVALAAIFQHDPVVFIAKQSSGIISPYEMQDKKVMLDFIGSDDAPLRAILAETGLNYQLIKHSFNLDDFINDKVDVMSVYLSNEPFLLQKKGIKINIINPQSYGVDFYGDILFTSQQQIDNHPERVEKFRRATLKGWQYALDHSEELIQLIDKKYHSRLDIEHLRFEAKTLRNLILPNSIPIGQIEPARLKKVADVYTQLKLVRPLTENDLAKFIYSPKTLNLTEQEQLWLKAHPVITLGIDNNFAPYEWVDNRGYYQGLIADYVIRFEQLLGVKFKIIKDKSWAEILTMAEHQQLDMIAAAVQTPEREKYLNFTPTYTDSPIIIINDMRLGFIGSLSKLNGKRIAVEKGYFMADVLKRDYPAIELVFANHIQDALYQVANGKADAYVGDAVSSNYAISQLNLLNLHFSGNTGYSSSHSVAVIKKHPELLSIMTKAIAAIPIREREQLNDRWVSLKVNQGVSTKTVIQYLLCFLIIVLFFVAWNLQLRREVTRRKKIEQKLRTLTIAIEQNPASVIITDLEANSLYVNPKFTETTGYSAEEMLGKNPRILKSGLTSDEIFKQLWDTLKQGDIWHGELINRRKNGEIYWEETHITPVKNSLGVISNYVGIKLDITHRKFVEEKLHFLFESSPLGFALNDLETGSFIEVNDAMFQETGYSKAEFLNLSYWDLTPRDYEQQEQQQLMCLLNTGRYGPYEKEYMRKDGSRYPVVLNGMLMHDLTGRKLIWSIVENITERKQAEETIKQLAFYDPLTQLPNRRLLQERLKHGIEVYHRSGEKMAILMMDLDKFKEVNDSLGHTAGDELLKQVAERVTHCLREMDTVARLGGDEFVIVLEKITHTQDIARIASAIIHILSQPFMLSETHQVKIGASIGVALYPDHGDNLDTLLDKADTALYQAKDAGRGCFVFLNH